MVTGKVLLHEQFLEKEKIKGEKVLVYQEDEQIDRKWTFTKEREESFSNKILSPCTQSKGQAKREKWIVQ